MTYEATISWLFEQFPAYHLLGVNAYKPSLDNIRALALAFDNPQDKLRFVHIAGTNGKGSTSNMLASILTESGETVGLFTSPHIHDFRERIRVNGTCIDEAFVIEFCEEIRSKTWNIEPSFFEITWLMALCYFNEKKCSIVVAETGLGGRLDATNIIQPLLTVITNISLDHTAILGENRSLIAAEKAGIIKQGIPIVIGESDEETGKVFAEFAQKHSSELVLVEPAHSYPDGIFGYQRLNFDTVYCCVQQLNKIGFQLSEKHVNDGIKLLRKNTGFSGRLEMVDRTPLTILDCAHNVAGIQQTIASINTLKQGQLHIIYGTSSDKDLSEIVTVLPQEAVYYLTEFTNPRSAKHPQLSEAFNNSSKKVNYFSSAEEAYQAVKLAANKNDTVLILGSFFLISDFFDLFFD